MTTQPRRHWFPRSFSLRTLLVLVVMLAVPLGWIASERRQSIRERQIAAELVKQGWECGCSESYDSYIPFGKVESKGVWRELATLLLGRRVRHISGQRSAELMHEPSSIDDGALVAIRHFTQTGSLYLGFQPITDEGMKSVVSLRSLRRLNLSGTRITDAGLKQLVGLNRLQDIALEFTAVTDTGLQSLGHMRQLRQIDLMGANVQGLGLICLSSLAELESLGLADNCIQSAHLQYLVELHNLKSLDLSGTLIDDSAAIHISQLVGLEKLSLDGTQISDEQVAALQQALPNCKIER